MSNFKFLNTEWRSVYAEAQSQESLAKAEDLFNSLLQKAFKGELIK